MLSARRVGNHAAARLASASAPITIDGVITPASGILISMTDWKPASITPAIVPSAAPSQQRERAAGNGGEHLRASRAERHSNADLARAARDHERQQRVDRDDRQQQRHHAERGHRRGHAREKRTSAPGRRLRAAGCCAGRPSDRSPPRPCEADLRSCSDCLRFGSRGAGTACRSGSGT